MTQRSMWDALNISSDTRRAIIGEVRRCQGGSWCGKSLEHEDLLSIAVITTWKLLQEVPKAGGGLIRIRVRWAVHEALRKEAFAHGVFRAHTRRGAAPRPERKCRCGKSLGTMALANVRCCPRCQLRLSAESSRRHRERKQSTRSGHD